MLDLGHHPGLGLPDGIRVSAAVSRFAAMHESANEDSEVAERSDLFLLFGDIRTEYADCEPYRFWTLS